MRVFQLFKNMTESVINKVNMRKVSALGVQVRSLKENSNRTMLQRSL
jgi:hypothetical protein